MIKTDNEWTIRTRNFTSGTYIDASFYAMPLAEAKKHALADHPNSEVVGVWPWVNPLFSHGPEALEEEQGQRIAAEIYR